MGGCQTRTGTPAETEPAESYFGRPIEAETELQRIITKEYLKLGSLRKKRELAEAREPYIGVTPPAHKIKLRFQDFRTRNGILTRRVEKTLCFDSMENGFRGKYRCPYPLRTCPPTIHRLPHPWSYNFAYSVLFAVHVISFL